MKAFLILILSFSFALATFGQDYPDSGFTNKAEAQNLTINGVREGKWIEYNYAEDEQDNIDTTKVTGYSLIVYKKGKIVGIVREYLINGKLVGEAPYVNGKLNGIVKTYYDNGQLYTLDTYTDSIQNGISKGYYKDGKLYYETTYTNGNEGTFKSYDSTGHEIK